jgi:hypothetical protein
MLDPKKSRRLVRKLLGKDMKKLEIKPKMREKYIPVHLVHKIMLSFPNENDLFGFV